MAFANVEQFVTRYLLEVTRRPGLQWCTTWWRHAEAVDRLRALWTSWEAMRWEGPTAMTVWWRDYCDPTVYALMKKDGTFASCDHSTDVHKQGRLLPTDQAPDGLLDEPEPEPGQGEN
nr:DUF4913 domain-containing protein [Naumannella cuiyingiana]